MSGNIPKLMDTKRSLGWGSLSALGGYDSLETSNYRDEKQYLMVV